MTVYRIGDPDGLYRIYSGQGAALTEGRWNALGEGVIYASTTYAAALLEKLVHYRGRLPPNQHFIRITLPAGLSYEVITKDKLPGWDMPDGGIARAFGSAWFTGRRTAILIVPGYVAREEQNVVINPLHRDSDMIAHGLEIPVWWDDRLFPRPAKPTRKR